MNFEHSEDRRMLEDTLRRYLAEQYDIGTRNRIAYGPQGYSPEKWAELAELGIVGALFPEAAGGFGGSGFDIAVVFEALGRALCPEPFLGAMLAGRALAAGGEAHAGTLAAVVDGTLIGAFAHEEEGSHYELSHVTTQARETAGGWVLSGAKSVVIQAEAAGIFIVTARLSGTADVADGIGVFAVPAGSAGLQVRGYNTVDGGRAGELRLDEVPLPASALIARDAVAFALIDDLAARANLALAAEGLGTMEVLKEATVEYLKVRKQFGTAIGKFQALQHRMADLVVRIEQTRSAVINAAAWPDDPAKRARALAAARVTVAESGRRVAEEALQMHGGIGITWEMPVSHYAKRLTMIGHQFGDEDYHLARYIVLSRGAAA